MLSKPNTNPSDKKLRRPQGLYLLDEISKSNNNQPPQTWEMFRIVTRKGYTMLIQIVTKPIKEGAHQSYKFVLKYKVNKTDTAAIGHFSQIFSYAAR